MVKDVYGYVGSVFRGKVVSLKEVEDLIRRYGYDYDARRVMNYMVRSGRAYRIIEDLYFVKGVGWYDYDSPILGRVLPKAFQKLGWKNWYYGLYSAWFNGRYAQQVYAGYVVINDRLSRKRKINGTPVLFIKTRRKDMFRFGIEENEWGERYSDIEKTVLDFIYFSNFGGIPRGVVSEIVESYFDPENFYMVAKGRNYRRLEEYLNYYPDFVRAELLYYLRGWALEIPSELQEVLA